MCNRKAQTLISHINIKDQRIKLTITHRFHPRYQLMSFTNKYWSPHKSHTSSHPLTVTCKREERKNEIEIWKFFAEGTVSNSPFSYSIQVQLAGHINSALILRLKNGPAAGQWARLEVWDRYHSSLTPHSLAWWFNRAESLELYSIMHPASRNEQ